MQSQRARTGLAQARLRPPVAAKAWGLLALICWLAPRPDGWAVPPTNDLCSGALVVPAAGPFPYLAPPVDILDASVTDDPPAASCQPFVGRSVWFVFTPSATTNYTISSCADAPTGTTVPDTVMAIYTSASGGCGGPFTELPSSGFSDGCEDDSCGPGFKQAAITTQLSSDTKYFILVWRYEDTTTPDPIGGETTVQLRISKAAPPPNDRGEGALPVFLNLPMVGTTVLANNDYQLPAGADCFTNGLRQIASLAAGRDVVYSFTAPDTDKYSIEVFNYNNIAANDLVLYVAASLPTGQSAPLTVTDCVAAANRSPASSAEEIVGLPLAAGQRVFIFVDEDAPTPQGSSFTLEVSKCVQETEPDDTPASASPLACGIEGSIFPANDADFFSLGTFPADSRAFVLVDGSTASTTDFILRVTTATDTLERDYGDNDAPFGELSSNVAGTPLPEAPAFIRVNYLAGGVNEPYRVFAAVQPPPALATPETEPNDTADTANSADNNYFYGSLPGPSPSTDVDVYRFAAAAGDLIFVSLDGDPLRDNTPINAKLDLLDQFGNLLVSVDDGASTSSTNVTQGALFAETPFSPAEALVYRTPDDGTFYARVSISPKATGAVGAGDYLLSIAINCVIGSSGYNNPPALTNLSVTSPIAETGSVLLTGTAIEYDLGNTLVLAINWGDGTSLLATNLPWGVSRFSLAHEYLEDGPLGTRDYPIKVTVTDNFGASASSGLTATVTNVPPSAPTLALSATEINENDSVMLTGSFTDPGSQDTHVVTIDWGDGSAATTSSLPTGVLLFGASHRYADDNPSGTPADNYSISVTVMDEAGGAAAATTSIQVDNVPPLFNSVAMTPSIFANGTATLTGSFFDPGTLDTFTLAVNWGDGTAVQTANLAVGSTSFELSHQYTVANTNALVTLTLTDDDTGAATTNATVQIKSAVAPARFQSISRLDGGQMVLFLQGTPGATYRIEASEDLKSWSTLGSATADANGLFQIEDPSGSSRRQSFFRAVWP